jgi:hypothetical protein
MPRRKPSRRISRTRFWKRLEAQAVHLRASVRVNDEAWYADAGGNPTWCRVVDVWDENEPRQRAKPRPLTREDAEIEARWIRAEIVVRGGRRLRFPTVELVRA